MLAVTRTMQILNELAASKDGLGVLELSQSLHIHKADVSRILSTLAVMNYVTQQGDDGKYRLSFKFVALGLKFRNHARLEDIVHPPLEDLTRRTGELVQFALVQNEEMIFVDKVEGVKPLRVASMLGQSAPLHATAVGKVWLASLAREKVLWLMEKRGMLAVTEHTITDAQRLLADLEEVRQRGYALSKEEVNRTVVGLAVPVYGEDNKVRAAVVVAIPVFEATPERLEEVYLATKETAVLLAERMLVFL